jgi:hypothetical protein
VQLSLEVIACGGANAQDPTTKISWKKIVIDTAFRSEGVAVADVNKDGRPDIIAGDCWYEAPKEPGGVWQRHILRADRKFDPEIPGQYSESFACFVDDFNGDGYPDVVVIPFPGKPCYWYENPGAKGGMWTPHLLTTSACNETPIYVDLFKTGKKILVMGWNPLKDASDPKKGSHDDRGEMCYFLPGKDPTQPWQRVSISGPPVPGTTRAGNVNGTIPGTARFAHGLGHGDVNGDGRVDVIVPQGWWEQPEKIDGKPWKFHAAKITDACADMFTYDMTGTGRPDILSSSAHNYGLWWSEQKAPDTFVQRALFPNPFDVAKLPENANLSAEEKKLIETINKLRNDKFRCAPFKVDLELCKLARRFGELPRSDAPFDKDALARNYSGKVIHLATHSTAAAGAKDFEKLALTLLPDHEKQKNQVRPGFEIGVGASLNAEGKTVFALIIGDRGRFSLPAQTHALQCVDIDGDGLKDLVTGRRWRAHGPKGDASPADPAYLYWFQARRDKLGAVTFVPHMIDDDSGIGTQFAVADINGDGLPDIAVSNKKGVYVFLQVR